MGRSPHPPLNRPARHVEVPGRPQHGSVLRHHPRIGEAASPHRRVGAGGIRPGGDIGTRGPLHEDPGRIGVGCMPAQRQARSPLPADAGRLVKTAVGLRKQYRLAWAVGRLDEPHYLAAALVVTARKKLAPGDDDPRPALRERLGLSVPVPAARFRAHVLPELEHVFQPAPIPVRDVIGAVVSAEMMTAMGPHPGRRLALERKVPGLPLAGRSPNTAAAPRFVDRPDDVEVFRHRRRHGEPEVVEDVPAEEHDEDRDIKGDADDSAVVAGGRLDELRQEVVEVVVGISELAPVEELGNADTLVGKPGEPGLIPIEDVDVPLGAVGAGERVGHGLGKHLVERHRCPVDFDTAQRRELFTDHPPDDLPGGRVLRHDPDPRSLEATPHLAEEVPLLIAEAAFGQRSRGNRLRRNTAHPRRKAGRGEAEASRGGGSEKATPVDRSGPVLPLHLRHMDSLLPIEIVHGNAFLGRNSIADRLRRRKRQAA